MAIFETLSNSGVVPVIAINDAEDALPLADALLEGGLPVAEITFRTDAARDVIAAISKRRPELILGAGTILTAVQAEFANAAGARFELSLGLDASILTHATAICLLFAPGIMTPTDIQASLAAGCSMVKFFSAMATGESEMLKNTAAAYAHTSVGFNPTGGVNLGNLADWLSMPQVRAVGGTWIAKREDIAAGNWTTITDNACEAAAHVRQIRGATK